jgi:hypothetical protein
MGPLGGPEVSARNYHSTLRKISKERRSVIIHITKRYGITFSMLFTFLLPRSSSMI